MQVFIRKPSIDFYTGIKVEKDTVLEYKEENVEQTIKDLVLHTVIYATGDNYNAVYTTNVFLQEGDVLIFEEGRGYIKPIESFVFVEEAIEDLTNIKGVGE